MAHSLAIASSNAVQPGVFAVKPITRTWRHYLPDGRYVNVKRKQMPLVPLEAVNLYSMQGTTADPGLYAYWMFPKRCSEAVQWLIVYVMLSRPRSLAQLRSINLTSKIRDIIQRGPPDSLVQRFHSLFAEKIAATAEIARQAAIQYGLVEESFR